MILTKASLCLILCPVALVNAIKCGTAISKDCIGESDERYDASVGYDLKAHAAVYSTLEGLYVGTTTIYFRNQVAPFIPTGDGMQFYSNPTTDFINHTVTGARFIQNYYGIAANLDGKLEGRVTLQDSYFAATFEKDGTATTLGLQSGFEVAGTPFEVQQDGLLLLPLNNRAVYGSGTFITPSSGLTFLQETWLCLDDSCTQFTLQVDVYNVGENETTPNYFQRTDGIKVASEEDWIQQMEAAMGTANITDRPTSVIAAECATGVCPTEEQWRTVDPYYQISPYQEPEGSLTPGFIGGITVACFIVVLAALYLLHRYLLVNQERRIRTAVARSVASTMGARRKADALTARDLQKHFDSLDKDGDGDVSKQDFKAFLDSSTVAELDDKDFEVLFATLDINGDHQIDFTEFCAFFAIIREEYDNALQRKSILQSRPSYLPNPAHHQTTRASSAFGKSLRRAAKESEPAIPEEGLEEEAKNDE